MHDVPVDAFWSVSVYNAAGYFEPTAEARYTVNSVTGVRDDDGAVTVHFTPPGAATEPNSIPLPEGWNYLIRLYRPREAFADGEWHAPDLVRRRDRRVRVHACGGDRDGCRIRRRSGVGRARHGRRCGHRVPRVGRDGDGCRTCDG